MKQKSLTLTEKERELFDILKRGGFHTTDELCGELNCEKPDIRALVRKLRKKFIDNEPEVDEYVFSSKTGYTVEARPEVVMHEARMRMAFGTGVLLNGVHVFKIAKKKHLKDFNSLKVEYKPGIIQIGKIF